MLGPSGGEEQTDSILRCNRRGSFFEHSDPFLKLREPRAAELVASKPDAISAFSSVVVAALQRESRTPPIAFTAISDPVGSGFVETRREYIRGTERYGRFAGVAGSVRLDACEAHYLAPLLGFLGDQLAEVSEPRFHVGIGEASVDLLV